MRKYEKFEGEFTIPDNKPVTVKQCGNITEIKFVSRRNTEAHIQRVGKDFYMRLKEDTGELHEIQHGSCRLDDTQGVKRSLERLRDYLNTNVTEAANCRWITFTYAENMKNPARLVTDFRAFNRRCRKLYGHYEYITAAEPQGRGAWHLHAVLIFDTPAPFMMNKTVREMWGQGFVNVRGLKNIDNIGLYLTAYLSDMDFEQVAGLTGTIPKNISTVEVINEKGKKEKKAVVKGSRLKLYPSGFHIYRVSKGIKKPIINVMSNAEAESTVSEYTLIYENSVRIFDDENDFNIVTNKRVYNKIPNAKNFIIRSVNNDNSDIIDNK